MADSKPVTVICRYEVKPGMEAEFEALLARHWPTLHAAGLVTDRRALAYKGQPSGKPGGRHGAQNVYVEIFEWKDQHSSGHAHESPKIMAVWEPMGACCSDMDFPHFEPLQLDG
ncbi:MAG TPA: hypothetical protein VM869_23015 [Enhygromyxa sp.]|nr:hypothetical protein [Enhygromyxa sp.]